MDLEQVSQAAAVALCYVIVMAANMYSNCSVRSLNRNRMRVLLEKDTARKDVCRLGSEQPR